MPTVEFIGVCHPGGAIIVKWMSKAQFHFGDLQGLMGFDVFGGRATVTCELEAFDLEKDNSLLNAYVHHAVKTLVDLIEFQCGMPVTITITQAHYPGEALPRMLKMVNPDLEGICTVCNVANKPSEDEKGDDSFIDLYQLVMNDWNLRLALDALTYSLDFPDMAIVNCARAIEHIRNMIAPDEDRKIAWQIMRETLNIGQNYLEPLSKASAGPRHGDFRTDLLKAGDARRRAWRVMNRYLEFRKRGGPDALPLSEFPLLTDSAPHTP